VYKSLRTTVTVAKIISDTVDDAPATERAAKECTALRKE